MLHQEGKESRNKNGPSQEKGKQDYADNNKDDKSHIIKALTKKLEFTSDSDAICLQY